MINKRSDQKRSFLADLKDQKIEFDHFKRSYFFFQKLINISMFYEISDDFF